MKIINDALTYGWMNKVLYSILHKSQQNCACAAEQTQSGADAWQHPYVNYHRSRYSACMGLLVLRSTGFEVTTVLPVPLWPGHCIVIVCDSVWFVCGMNQDAPRSMEHREGHGRGVGGGGGGHVRLMDVQGRAGKKCASFFSLKMYYRVKIVENKWIQQHMN